jgi:hypothetical protein
VAIIALHNSAAANDKCTEFLMSLFPYRICVLEPVLSGSRCLASTTARAGISLPHPRQNIPRCKWNLRTALELSGCAGAFKNQ